MAVEVEVVFESHEIAVVRKITGSAAWQSFIVNFKRFPDSGKFPIGWNGSRFAKGSEYDKLNRFSPATLEQLEKFFRAHYSNAVDGRQNHEGAELPSSKQKPDALQSIQSQQIEAIDDSRQYDLLIFDLDDTLLATGHLEPFRGKKFVGPQDARYKRDLAAQARSVKQLVPEDVLLALQKNFPSMALSVFTRAPKDYALTLLEVQFPRVNWKCVVAFEDVTRTKPHPDGIYLAARNAGVKDASRIALVGDGESDVIAAYEAGIQFALLMIGWGSNWNDSGAVNRREHYKVLELMPDAKIETGHELYGFVTKPCSLLPCLEAWSADEEFTQPPASMRVDRRKHFNNLDDAGYPNWVETHALGRYFPSTTGRFNFSKREIHHSATKAVLDAKDGVPYPIAWVDCCANYIFGYANSVRRQNMSLVVCPIPSNPKSNKSLGRDRLIVFLQAVEAQLADRCQVSFDFDVLRYAPGAESNKTLGRDARFANVRDHMFVADPSLVQGLAVLVVDDVSTSGATFYYASRYLIHAGARSVRCLTLTQTVS